MNDWTSANGRSNSSELYNTLVDDVERTIRDGAFFLVTGRVNDIARQIVAHMAHRHHLAPTNENTVAVPRDTLQNFYRMLILRKIFPQVSPSEAYLANLDADIEMLRQALND